MTPNQRELTEFLASMAFKPGSVAAVKRWVGDKLECGLVHSLGGAHYTLVSRDVPGVVVDYDYGHLIVDAGWLLD